MTRQPASENAKEKEQESSLRKNTSDQFLGGSSIQPDWLRRRHEFSRPVPYQRIVKQE